VTADRVIVRGITATGFHGVFDFERREGQPFVVDVELAVDLERAGASDDLTHTVHYGEVAADVVARIEGEPFDLIERLAQVIAEDALARPLVESVTVTVHKPKAPVGVEFGDVEVRVTRARPLVPVVIAVGANLGEPAAAVMTAIHDLLMADWLEGQSPSLIHETDPVGGPEQPNYANAVVTGRTRLSAPLLLDRLHDLENAAGRTREIRWGPRTLDLDLIQYGEPGEASELRSDDPELTLPHPRAHSRAFVLVPWLQADPHARLRVGDDVRPVGDLVEGLDTSGVRPLEGDGWFAYAPGSGERFPADGGTAFDEDAES
jgi:dihydroneopterin aldolase/2-amino-4-hydroxy-6-hydroxymethyldihydropteridine diphosphokinase